MRCATRPSTFPTRSRAARALTLAALALAVHASPAGAGPQDSDGPAPEGSDPADTSQYAREYHFTRDWFTRHVPVWRELLAPYAGEPETSYLEVGVFEGRSALWMAENVLTHPTARMTVVDIFERPNLEETWRVNLHKSGFEDRTTTIKAYSNVALRGLPPDSFDVIYIDGSHDAPDVLLDAALSWDLLKDGGLLVFDDYAHRREQPDDLRPAPAIDAFLTTHRNLLEVVHRDYQVFVRKIGSACPDRSDCFRIGEHVYVWNAKKLYGAEGGDPVAISGAESDLIDELIRGRARGATEYAPSPALRAEPTFKAMCERLGWEL